MKFLRKVALPLDFIRLEFHYFQNSAFCALAQNLQGSLQGENITTMCEILVYFLLTEKFTQRAGELACVGIDLLSSCWSERVRLVSTQTSPN